MLTFILLAFLNIKIKVHLCQTSFCQYTNFCLHLLSTELFNMLTLLNYRSQIRTFCLPCLITDNFMIFRTFSYLAWLPTTLTYVDSDDLGTHLTHPASLNLLTASSKTALMVPAKEEDILFSALDLCGYCQ